jgi:hypothetical protein
VVSMRRATRGIIWIADCGLRIADCGGRIAEGGDFMVTENLIVGAGGV